MKTTFSSILKNGEEVLGDFGPKFRRKGNGGKIMKFIPAGSKPKDTNTILHAFDSSVTPCLQAHTYI
jgi:hypothetical protein